MKKPTYKRLIWQLFKQITALTAASLLCYIGPSVFSVSAVINKWNGRTMEAIYDIAVFISLMMMKDEIMEYYENIRQESIRLEKEYIDFDNLNHPADKDGKETL